MLTMIFLKVPSLLFAQEGHLWWFGSSVPPYASVPTSGNVSSNLSVLGSATITPGSTDVTWSTNCTTDITHVAAFDKGAGFSFSNTGANAVTTSYTIELVFKMNASEDNTWRRLIGFYDLNSLVEPDFNDNGIYVDHLNGICFYTFGLSNQYLPSGMIVDTWHHLVFTRAATSDNVDVYHNGILKGTFNDPYEHLIPKVLNSNKITFFKDNDGGGSDEETSGKWAKISVYNSVLSLGQIGNLFANACSSTPLASSSNENSWGINGNNNTSSSSFIGTTNSEPVIIKTNSTEAVKILPTGEVGIGSDAPRAGYRLAIKGNVLAEKVVVKSPGNWPDYVFDSTYQLLSLKEVNDFIKKNKHLPDVPSASEVEKNGLNLSDSHSVLLRKIEELMLYIIEQDKINRNQQELIEQLLKKKNK